MRGDGLAEEPDVAFLDVAAVGAEVHRDPVRARECGDDGAIVLRHLTGAADAPPRSRVVASGAGGVFPRGVEVGVWLGGGLVQPSVPLSSVEDVFIRRAQ